MLTYPKILIVALLQSPPMANNGQAIDNAIIKQQLNQEKHQKRSLLCRRLRPRS